MNPVSPLQIPVQETSYLRGESYQGPNGLISEYGTIGHRYFGFAYVTCENCTSEKWYWIYSIEGNKDKSWYIELDHSEPKFWNPIQLLNEPEKYIEKNFPEYRRIKIK